MRTERLIDADDAKRTYTAGLFDTEEDFERVNDIFDYAPTVDAEVVVRCKDCKWDRPDTLLDKHWCSRLLGCMEVRADDFCSYGERKDCGDADR